MTDSQQRQGKRNLLALWFVFGTGFLLGAFACTVYMLTGPCWVIGYMQ